MAFTTRLTTLERIKKGDEMAWNQFREAYKALMFLRGADFGLSADEKEQLVQDVMVSLFMGNSVFRYDKSKGRFRDYLKTIIDRRAIDIIRKRVTEHRTTGDNGETEVASDDTVLDEKWDRAWYQHILAQALDALRGEIDPDSFQVIMMLLNNAEPKTIAETLNRSVENVYVVKHRVLRRLRHEVARLIEES